MTPASTRYHSLDAWRGLACLMVVVFHSTEHTAAAATGLFAGLIAIVERLWIGVPLFFVISGYCISATADSSRRKGHGSGEYFARRLRRIFPPYLIFLAITIPVIGVCELAVPGLFDAGVHPIRSPWMLNGWEWLGTLTLTGGWLHHLVGTPTPFFLGHAWTLGYEEQFYAVTGLLLMLCPRRFFAGIVAVTLAVIALKATSYGLSGFFFDGLWFYFAAGILVYGTVVYGKPQHRWLASIPLLLGIALSLRNFGLLAERESNGAQMSLAAYGFALAILWLHRYDARIAAARFVAPLNYCGLRCYSLYLVHWPICKGVSHALDMAGFADPASTVLVTIPICLVLTVLAGSAFFHLVESRFLNTSPAKTEPAVHRPEGFGQWLSTAGDMMLFRFLRRPFARTK